mgnify:CR=1 FL=1
MLKILSISLDFYIRFTVQCLQRLTFLYGGVNGKSTLICPTVRTDGCRILSVNLAKNDTLRIVLFLFFFDGFVVRICP